VKPGVIEMDRFVGSMAPDDCVAVSALVPDEEQSRAFLAWLPIKN
jgi:hypothetical protein